MADADDEFARFEAELRALEAAAPPEEEDAAAPAPEALIAPAMPPPRPAPAHAVAARPAVTATIARPAVAPAPGPAALPPPPPPPPPNPMLAGFYAAQGAVPYAAPPPYGYPPHAAPGLPPPFAPQGFPPPYQPAQAGAPGAAAAGGAGRGPSGPAPPMSKAAIAASHAAAVPGAKVVHVRSAAGERWVDPTMAEWPENDHRIFVGDLGKEVSDEVLIRAFAKYPGFLKAKVVKNTSTGQHKGYGFVSFADISSMVKALREMDGKYIGNRPCKLKKSTWQTRDAGVAVVGPDKRIKTKEIVPAHKRRHVPTLQSGPPGAH